MLWRFISVSNTLNSSWQLEKAETWGIIKSAFAPQLRPHKTISRLRSNPFPPRGMGNQGLFFFSWCKGWKLLNSQLCYFFWPSSPFQQTPLLAGPRCLALFSILLFCFFMRAETLAQPRRWEGTKQHTQKPGGQDPRGKHWILLLSTYVVFATAQVNRRPWVSAF